MKRSIGYILLVLSLICIITTGYELIYGKIYLFTIEFYGAIIFHGVSAHFANVLLERRCRE